MSTNPERESGRLTMTVAGVDLVLSRDFTDGGPLICAAHPSEAFGVGTVALLKAAAGPSSIVCVNPAGIGGSTGTFRATLEDIVDDFEQVRLRLGARRWVFWGMSGGGWLGLIYAHRHPEALAGLIVESGCACFRARVTDPTCALSPSYPAWRPTLAAAGLLAERADADDTAPLGRVDTEWIDVAGVGAVFRRRGGPALLVSPMPVGPAMRAMMPVFWNLDARPTLRSVRVPTLIICGTADPVVPVAHARVVHDAVAGSTFVAIAGAGHVPTSERRPEVTVAVQGFLASLPFHSS